MAAASEVQVYLGLEEFGPVPKRVESDSDSGQGSCGMISSSELGRMENLDDGDSDEEIVVSKKSKNKKLVVESDSEAEVMDTARNEDEESGEENKENVSGLKGKPGRIRSAPLDSEDSDREDKIENVKTSSEHPTSKDTSTLKQKKSPKSKKQDVPSKLKSKRRTEKAEKRMVSIGKLKKEKKKSEMLSEEERPPLNDSGCLLANGDLFENEVGDEIDPVDEDSLDAIRAKVTDKFKGRSYADYDGSDPEQEFGDEPDHGGKRKERKAARMSKEAMKLLHSETQRLIRESSVSMPYHLPEPKTIHDFFKRRQRPSCQGNVMHLIKSSKYQPFLAEERTNTQVNKATEVEKTGSDPTVEPTIDTNRPCQAPSDTDTVDQENTKQIDAEEECEPMTVTDNPDTSSKTSPCEDQKESIQETEEHAENIVGVIPQEICHPHAVNKDGETDQNNGSSSSTTAPLQRLPKLSKLEKLRALGVDLSLKPRLCPDDGSFVNLDDPQPNKELEALKQRFLKHSLHKAKPVVERKINITVVHKETTADGKEELKADVVPVTMAGEKEEQIHAKPGEKLLVLKAKLQEAMKVRRSEERQKRQALFNLDNEDGFNDDEEEAEMTDSEEEEEEGNAETAEYLLGEAEEEDEDSLKHDELEKDGTEASLPERSMATESTLMLFKDHSTKLGDSLPDKIDNGDCKGIVRLEEEDSLLTKENSHNSSFELIGSMIPSYQPFNKNARGSLHSSIGGFRSPSPMHFKTSFLSSASKSSGKMSEPSLPVEDSQDLYNASPEPKAYLCPGGESQFRFSLEDDTQSQLLDADGFLNVGHHRSKYSSAKQRLAMDTMDENAMDANMGELLDLCSGQFHVSSQVAKESKAGAMEELLGLCSGTFVTQAKTSTQICSPSKSQSQSQNNDAISAAAALCSSSFTVEREDEDEEEEEEFGEFQLLPCDDLDSEQDEGNDGENEGSDDEKEVSDEEEVLRQQQKTKKLRLKDFMENEAELSGSDNGSGDEEEGDEDDEYEEESIDEELPSDEDLQDQVNKIHMKVTMDEDKRRLRLYQERYLADGDLHSDGPGRMRKYRWKMFDDASQLDMFRRDSELEDQEVDNEELDEAEIKWRKERFEREQWMREQSESRNVPQEEEEDIGEDSQFMKLAKKVTAKALQRRATTESKELKKPVSRNPFEVMRTFSNPKMQTGSLLNKPKEVLQKLAAMSNVNPNAPRNSRNFVFQTLSPAKKEPSADRPKPKVRKNIALTTPSPKRFKPDNTSNCNSRSVFPFLEN